MVRAAKVSLDRVGYGNFCYRAAALHFKKKAFYYCSKMGLKGSWALVNSDKVKNAATIKNIWNNSTTYCVLMRTAN